MSHSTRTKEDLIALAMRQRKWAIVGASEDTSKYGNIIYRDLKREGYEVYGVNPNASTVAGDTVYPTVADLPVKPDVVNVVVPSWIGRRIAEDAAREGIKIFWLQPGADSTELIEYARSLGLDVIHHACSMVAARMHQQRGDE